MLLMVSGHVYPSEWHTTPYGRYMVTGMANSPFPDTSNSGPAFRDSSVYFFIPDGYQKKNIYDLIVDHHGFGTIIDPANDEKTSYPELFRQDYQLYMSGKNAILIIPQAARNVPNGAQGKFAQMNGFQKFIAEADRLLKKEGILLPASQLRDIHISSFSGGYYITAMDISQNSPDFLTHIRSVNLWDSFYGHRDIYFQWAMRPDRLFFSSFTPTGGTVQLNRQLQDSLRIQRLEFDTIRVSDEILPKRLIEYTHRSHWDVATGEFSYMKYLARLPLDDIDIRPPELISVIPGEHSVSISWNRQNNSLLAGYRLWAAGHDNDFKLIADEKILNKQSNHFSHNTKSILTYKLEAVSVNGNVKPARFHLTGRPGDSSPRILLVHAENRWINPGVKGFLPEQFLYPPQKDLTGQTGQWIPDPFASCSNQALREGRINPADFDRIIWLAGNEGPMDKIIDHNEDLWLRKYLAQGGNLLLSGTGIPADLASNLTSPPDRSFGEQICGISRTDSIKYPVKAIQMTSPFNNQTFSVPGNSLPELSFTFALVPVIRTQENHIIGTVYKKEVDENRTATVLTLAFSLALINQPELQRTILREFFQYCDSGPLSPDPAVLPAGIMLDKNGIYLGEGGQFEKIIIDKYNAAREWVESDTLDTNHPGAGNLPDALQFLRLRALSGAMISPPSEMLASYRSKSQKARVLLINGFDRVTGTNTFDYVIEHCLAFIPDDYSISSASNEAVEQGLVQLSDFDLVDWILGEESTADHCFTPLEQTRVRDYLAQGGKLLVSGSEIGWDMVEKAAAPQDSLFFSAVLGAAYLSDDADSDRFLFENDTIRFGGKYPVLYPDEIKETDFSRALLRYDNNRVAATGYPTAYSGSVVLVAFPLETITPDARRNQVFKFLTDYLMRTQ